MRIPITVRDVKAMAYDKNKYNLQYKKDHFDQLKFYVPKGYKDKIKKYAESHNTSITEICKQALYEKVGLPDSEI